MANLDFKDDVKTYEGGVRKLFAKVVTGSTGAIASQVSKGLTVTKTAGKTGRYTVTLSQKYTSLKGCSVALEAQADSAYPLANGSIALLRGVAVDAATPQFEVQFVRPDSAVDAEVEDASVFYLEIALKNTSSF